jgi:hypothetical protein
MEIKPLSVTKSHSFEYVTRKVIPMLLRPIFPHMHDGNFRVDLQHDNAPVHFLEESDEWQQFKVQPENNRFDFVISPQSPNSLDTNIHDLGFFNSLQSKFWHEETPTDLEGLIAAVEKVWNEYNEKTLERVWLSHGLMCDNIISHHGDNGFDTPHMSKEKLERAGTSALEDLKLFDILDDADLDE